ncbi:DUF4321 domain-containing protein [Desulfovirgula thermocuniculi]|uniref:DUF4321 domain-containing protein n=1 Tax=Desulfovirgula thermocuniculi TaxID=348842 RepID=UPI0004131D83|nr:DUF4321 domain-containing protein [Desulfovirgula thermocuniculi]
MPNAYKPQKSLWLLFVLLLVGALVGDALGAILIPYLPLLKPFTSIGLAPATADLHFLRLTFGFTLTLGPMTALGLLLGYFLYRKL